MTNPTVRDGMIHQAQQERMVRDTLVLQKINKAHRESFTIRFPVACEHMMRLTQERLQAILTAKPKDLTDPDTWVATAGEIRDLTEALYYLSLISKEYPIVKEDQNES